MAAGGPAWGLDAVAARSAAAVSGSDPDVALDVAVALAALPPRCAPRPGADLGVNRALPLGGKSASRHGLADIAVLGRERKASGRFGANQFAALPCPIYSKAS